MKCIICKNEIKFFKVYWLFLMMSSVLEQFFCHFWQTREQLAMPCIFLRSTDCRWNCGSHLVTCEAFCTWGSSKRKMIANPKISTTDSSLYSLGTVKVRMSFSTASSFAYLFNRDNADTRWLFWGINYIYICTSTYM